MMQMRAANSDSCSIRKPRFDLMSTVRKPDSLKGVPILFGHLDSERLQRIECIWHQTLTAALSDWRFERVDYCAFNIFTA
jgi:hypothetical protein